MSTTEIKKAFTPVIHREDGQYWAEIPAMPGCLTVADTLQELEANILDAMRCWLTTKADLERRLSRKANSSLCASALA